MFKFHEVRNVDVSTWRSANPDAFFDNQVELQRYLKGQKCKIDMRALATNYAHADFFIEVDRKERMPVKLVRSTSDQGKSKSIMFYKYLSENQNPAILPLIERRIEEEANGGRSLQDEYNLCRRRLSANPTMIYLLMKYPELIIWECFLANPAPEAVEICTEEWKNPTGKVERWDKACCNPALTHVIVEMFYKCPESVNMDYLAANPAWTAFIYAQLEEDKIRERDGKIGRMSPDAIYENHSMIDWIKEQIEKDPQTVYWNRLCQYNFAPYANVARDSRYSAKTLAHLVQVYKRTMDAKDADDEIDEYRKMVSFEVDIHKPLCKLYNKPQDTTSDNLVPLLREDTSKVNNLLGETPIQWYIEMKLRRSRLAHQGEFWDGYTTHMVELDEYRELKYFEFVKRVIALHFKTLTSYCSTNAVDMMIKKYPTKFKTIVQQNRDLLWVLDVNNPIKEFELLRKRRNRIAHSLE